ncbi:hypothetical protein G7Y79_00013g035450 [Physcia stellaris]|nr:hypothetical protein G7Y79_00013g035450 [Physcia stellaris]
MSPILVVLALATPSESSSETASDSSSDATPKEADILGRNRLTANRCTQALTSLDCDTKIGVQTLGEASSQLLANSTAYSASSTYIIEALSHCGRSLPHVRWEAESIWPAAAPNALLFSEGHWQKQLQIWPHTNPHYVILQCGGLTCFQIGQIRSISSSACPGETVGPHITFANSSIFFSFGIAKGV